jgi:hypothetical protein
MGFHRKPGVDVSDADAAVGDVKTSKTFYSVAPPRKTGTLETTLIAEAQSVTKTTAVPDSYASDTMYRTLESILAEGDLDPFITKTDTFSATSMAVAAFGGILSFQNANYGKVRLWMGGVQVAESAYINVETLIALVGNRALSGSQEVKATIHNYRTEAQIVKWFAIDDDTTKMHPILAAGSVKI